MFEKVLKMCGAASFGYLGGANYAVGKPERAFSYTIVGLVGIAKEDPLVALALAAGYAVGIMHFKTNPEVAQTPGLSPS